MSAFFDTFPLSESSIESGQNNAQPFAFRVFFELQIAKFQIVLIRLKDNL